MHTVTMNEDFGPLQLQRGETYLLNDVNAATVLAWEAGTAQVRPVAKVMPHGFLFRRRLPASVLIIRAGGFGDLIALRPALAALVAAGARVGVACFGAYHEALTASGAECHEYPVNVKALRQWEHVMTLENLVEKSDAARRLPLVDLFCQALNLKLSTQEKRPRYAVPAFFREWARGRYVKEGVTGRIGVQLRASAACRSWDFESRVKPAVQILLKKGYQVLLFDTPGRAALEGAHPRLVAVFADPEVKTWHQTAALLETCDGFLGPDSGVTHLAGALGVPGLALFGAFPSRLRVDCYPSLKAMEGAAPCAPCFHHTGATGIQWPEGGPCVKTGKCVALQELVPVRVVHQLEKWMEERRGAKLLRPGLEDEGGGAGGDLVKLGEG